MKRLLINKVLKPIVKSGFKAYFVGGCVRDELLNVTPHDYDITTDATPEQLHTIFDKFSNVSKNAEQFGVTMVLIPTPVQADDLTQTYMEVEIATFRKDITKGRHPEISLTTDIVEDAMRRDFTINALYQDIDGSIYDPTDYGLYDLNHNILRFVGDPKERLREDPLRAFRFVRFLSQKNFKSKYDEYTISSYCKNLDFSEVSKERMLKEIKQIFAGKYFTYESEAFNMAFETGMFEVIGLQKIFSDLDMIDQSFKWHSEGAVYKDESNTLFLVKNRMDLSKCEPDTNGSALYHSYRTFAIMHELIFNGYDVKDLKIDFDEEKIFLLKLGALLHDIGKAYCNQGFKTQTFIHNGKEFTETSCIVNAHPQVGIEYAERFCKKLRLSNEETHFICSIVAHHMDGHRLNKHKHLHEIYELTTHPYFKEIMLVSMADDLASVILPQFVSECADPIQKIMNDEKVQYCLTHPLPDPILTGDDLIKYGKKPGPIFKKILETAYHIQIDQSITDKDKLYKMSKNVTLTKDGK